MTRISRELEGPAAHPIGADRTAVAHRGRVLVGALAALAMVIALLGLTERPASAQDTDRIIQDLERQGWYIESGADGTTGEFSSLSDRADGRDDNWYFVSLAGPADPDYADLLRDEVRPTGNVIVYFIDADDFLNVQFASGSSESVENQALAPFDGDWVTPDEFMIDVVTSYERLTASSSGSTGSSGSSGTTTTGTSGSSESSGGVPGWLLVAVPVGLIGGGIWFSGRRKKSKDDADELETAKKIRAEIQSELDELANDVIVLNSAVDLSDDATAVTHYREATATYTDISDEIPDLDELENANLQELSELGARVAHARWQMDASEAIIGGEPIPEKPKVEPPPAPARPAQAPSEPVRVPPRIQQRQARSRTPYSRSRRSSGGGLLDILIAGAGMMGNNRRRSGGGMFGGNTRTSGRSSGGMFGGGRAAQRQTRRSTRSSSGPRSGGGVFGGGSGSRSSGSRRSSSRRSTSRTRSRPSRSSSSSRSRASSSRRSSSKRRRR